jgi:hypothetical protein
MISTVSRPGLRSTNWIEAVACDRESGATTLSTFVREIALFSSFSPSVTAKAAAVQPRRASTTTIGRTRVTRRRV